MKTENKLSVTEIANNISIQDMSELINIFSDRIDIFIGCVGNKEQNNRMQLSGSLSKENPSCLNGPILQINMEYTDEDNDFLSHYSKYIKST